MHSRSPCKMFVGGLDWKTSVESLHEYFSMFGDLTECSVVRNPSTGTSRGFGFIEFTHLSSVEEVLSQEHVLDGKSIDPKLAIKREEQIVADKIFVRGLPSIVDETELIHLFSQFGRVLDVSLKLNKEGIPRGCGSVTFATTKSAEDAIIANTLKLGLHEIEIRPCERRPSRFSSRNDTEILGAQKKEQQQQHFLNNNNNSNNFETIDTSLWSRGMEIDQSLSMMESANSPDFDFGTSYGEMDQATLWREMEIYRQQQRQQQQQQQVMMSLQGGLASMVSHCYDYGLGIGADTGYSSNYGYPSLESRLAAQFAARLGSSSGGGLDVGNGVGDGRLRGLSGGPFVKRLHERGHFNRTRPFHGILKSSVGARTL